MNAATVYQSSTGPKPIKDMNEHNVRAAHAKLLRDDPGRLAEIKGLALRIAQLDGEQASKGADEGAGAVPAPAPMGDNNPPTLDTFEAIAAHIADLYDEAKNWLDGEAIATQAQADEVSRLKAMIVEAEALADKTRRAENEPFDTAKAQVQARYAPLISDTKSVRGKTVLAREACQRALTPWLRKLEDEREAKAKAARDEAEALAAKAREAAKSDDLAVVEKAEEMFAEAKGAEREARSIETGRAAAGGGEYRRTILRDNWTCEVTDGQALLRHYWQTRRADIEAFALKLVQEEVRFGKREIPGVRVWNDQRAA